MCGILISLGSVPINSISHRGTEVKTVVANGVNLTHHRLPIQTIDGDDWSMPYEYLPGKYLLFNGEIFNYDLDKYSSDTEYLVEFFRSVNVIDMEILSEYKSEMSKWDGFWSIVLYDSDSKTIIAFNDPLGKKQLYVNTLGEICSEQNPIVLPDDSFDNTYLGTIHKFGYNHDERTPWKSVKRLRPDYWYSYSLNKPDVVLTMSNIKLEPDSNLCVRTALIESTKRRLLSKNYPISVLLSGGLDSTILTYILESAGANVSYYTIDNGEDEYVRLCEAFWNIKVTRLTYDLDESSLKPIYCNWNESPIDLGSVVPQYHLFEAVAKTGNRIVISGDGADELFGGYRRISEYDSQGSDVFHELTYYHLPRLDKMSMAHTIELRSPFLGHDVIRAALALPLCSRTHKQILKDAFADDIPREILDRSKAPLKNASIKVDPLKYRKKILNLYKESAKDFLYLHSKKIK